MFPRLYDADLCKRRPFIDYNDGHVFLEHCLMPAARAAAKIYHFDNQVPVTYQNAMDLRKMGADGRITGHATISLERGALLVFLEQLNAIVRSDEDQLFRRFGRFFFVCVTHGVKDHLFNVDRASIKRIFERELDWLQLDLENVYVDVATQYGYGDEQVGLWKVSHPDQTTFKHREFVSRFFGPDLASANYTIYPFAGMKNVAGFTYKSSDIICGYNGIMKMMAYHTTKAMFYKRDDKHTGVDVSPFNVFNMDARYQKYMVCFDF